MKGIVILFVFYLFVFHSYAQDRCTVTGKILNESKEPIAFATVYIIHRHKVFQSDENGVFSFTALPEEELEIQISAVGYQTQSRSLKVRRSKFLFCHSLKSHWKKWSCRVMAKNCQRQNLPKTS